MSMESAKAFIDRMRTDEVFARVVVQCKDQETRMAFAVEQGFDFTSEEVNSLKTQLTDEELNSVGGGLWVDPACQVLTIDGQYWI